MRASASLALCLACAACSRSSPAGSTSGASATTGSSSGGSSSGSESTTGGTGGSSSSGGSTGGSGACLANPTPGTPAAPVACGSGGCWQPGAETRWYYQLSSAANGDTYPQTGGVNVGVTALPYTGGTAVAPLALDFDLYDLNTGDTLNTGAVSAVHANGARAICYVSAGSYENWRPDAADFPSCVLGDSNGWSGEQWLDIRQTAILIPIMQARLQKCVQAGFDAVEWDNVDGVENTTGFPLTMQDQLYYDTTLANLAHQAGLAVALKNFVDQIATVVTGQSQLVDYYDLTVNEECYYNQECASLAPFLAAGKAVLEVEYTSDGETAADFCPDANANDRNGILCDLNLTDQTYTPCR